ncbi:TIR domain-containing protein [uncultured Fibrobacter sp.]|uniref:TIR domain-containing protein n=1 Tax=uncultured Fibrobacter sp. TaxID=261512 RepID=UPI00260CA688|nr:TIR domain-containing protein [uncultured Fibrobacter sp.]
MALFNINRFEKIASESRGKIVESVAQESARLNSEMYCFSQFDDSKKYDIFLSHSYKDRVAVAGLVKYLKKQYGYEIYVDWIEDNTLDRSRVTKETANVIKTRMKNCKCLFYVTSENAPSSKWMPWELGLMDGLKDRVAVCPLTREVYESDAYRGQEYLGIYPYISETKTDKGQNALWVNNDERHYIIFEEWLKGCNPYLR